MSDKIVAASGNPKLWFKLVDSVLEKDYKPPIPGLCVDGEILATDPEKANALVNHFSKQTCLSVPDGHSPALAASNKFAIPVKTPSEFKRVRLRRIKVQESLDKLAVTKATGNDQIPAILLNKCSQVLTRPLTRIFRSSLKHGYFPSDWKRADVVALHKKKSKSDPGNYRPISLLSIISKVFESLICSRLKKHIDPLLNKHQFGFRSGHTSMDLLTNMSQRWINQLAEGGEVRAVALDISKAFDKVWHDGLLFKMKRFGISGSILSWFRSYLSDRSQRVVIESSFSDYADVNAGVPQGSVAGPLLFLMFIDDLFDVVDNNLDVFADDSTLWSSIPEISKRVLVAKSLNSDLVKIAEWATRWIVTYNAGKTELVTFSRKHDTLNFRSRGVKNGKYDSDPSHNPHPPIQFQSSVIPEGKSFTVVGLTFTSDLSWTAHINKVAVGAKRAVSMLFRAKEYLSKEAVLTLYKSHIRPKMEYLSPIWTGGSQTALNKLNNIQKRVLDYVGSIGNNLPSLGHRRGVAGLCFIQRLINNSAPAPVLELCPPRFQSRRHSSRLLKDHLAPQYFKKNYLIDHPPSYWDRSCVPLFSQFFNQLTAEQQSVALNGSSKAFKKVVSLNADFRQLWAFPDPG